MYKNISTNNYIAENGDSFLDCSCGVQTNIILPKSSSKVGSITIKKVDSGANTIVVNATGTEKIAGTTNYTISVQNEYATFLPVTDGYRISDVGLTTETTQLANLSTLKTKITPEGGIAVKLTNKTGGTSVKGEVVTVYSATAINNAVSKIIVNVPDPIGVIYESGIADGSEVWVIVSGIAEAYFIGNTTRGHLARGFLTSDGGSYVAGRVLSEAFPLSPFASDKHFYEIGHVLESRTGAGLAKVALHFN